MSIGRVNILIILSNLYFSGIQKLITELMILMLGPVQIWQDRGMPKQYYV